MKDKDEGEEKPCLAHWVDIVPPASLSTKTGHERFVVTIKLAEKSPKTAVKFVTEMNDALKRKPDRSGNEPPAQFVLVDSERARLQRATASFSTFRAAQKCLCFLKELGLPTNDVSPEFEDFGIRKYDPWYESISQAWWPWFAAWRNPAPELPMMKATNRLNVSEGGKYKEGAGGKLGKSDDVDRDDPKEEDDENGGKKRGKNKARKDDGEGEGKPRRKKRADDEEQSEV